MSALNSPSPMAGSVAVLEHDAIDLLTQALTPTGTATFHATLPLPPTVCFEMQRWQRRLKPFLRMALGDLTVDELRRMLCVPLPDPDDTTDDSRHEGLPFLPRTRRRVIRRLRARLAAAMKDPETRRAALASLAYLEVCLARDLGSAGGMGAQELEQASLLDDEEQEFVDRVLDGDFAGHGGERELHRAIRELVRGSEESEENRQAPGAPVADKAEPAEQIVEASAKEGSGRSSVSADSSETAATNTITIFKDEGRALVTFFGETAEIRRSKVGIDILACLLEQPNSPVDQLSIQRSAVFPRKHGAASLAEQQSLLDQQALLSLRRRRDELKETRESTSCPLRKSEISEELRGIELQLDSTVDRFGKTRNFQEAAEKRRISDHQAFTRLKEEIRAQVSALACHLDEAVSISRQSVYAPARVFGWRVERRP